MDNAPNSAGSPRLESIQILRFGAAFLVVLYHLFWQAGKQFPVPQTLFWVGNAGVDVFFVVSGFIVCYTVRSVRRPWDFFKKRIFRVVPIYWVLTLALALVGLLVPQVIQSTVVNFETVWKSLLFIPHRAGAEGAVRPLLFLGWTLNYEFFFYTLFAVVMAISRRPYGVTVVLLVALVGFGRVYRGSDLFISFYTDGILLEFAYGILIFLWYQRFPNTVRKLGTTALVTGVVVLALIATVDFRFDVGREFVFGFPAALVVAGALGTLPPRNVVTRLALLLGDASYSIYLVHPFVLQAIFILLTPIVGLSFGGFVALGLLSVLAVLLVSFVSYFSIERTTNAYLRQRYCAL